MPASVKGEQSLFQFSAPAQRRIYRVTELNDAVQQIFDSDFRGILVSGEISGCRTASSGHYYFSLKDGQSQIKCALFKGSARFSRFKPQDGLAVIARGNLELYSARGEYQLIVESLEPQGAGALQIAFEQLKQKLAAEGLFDGARKRALPKRPQRIGIVTSPSGAVIQDILHVFERRFRGLHIRVFPALVQGEGSIEQVCAGLRYFGSGWAELVILARGGGSLEDLWTFNEEAVARAIAGSGVPVISAIGHETDFTISDFVADLRAPTPSAAAEIAICTVESLLEQISVLRQKALQCARYRLLSASRDLNARAMERADRLIHRQLSGLAQRLDECDEQLDQNRRLFFERKRARLAEMQKRLEAANLQLRLSRVRHCIDLATRQLVEEFHKGLEKKRYRQSSLALHLRQLSPLAILERGYAVVQKADGAIVRQAADVATGEALRIRVSQGEIGAMATGVSGLEPNG